jgi:hypothetical protein
VSGRGAIAPTERHVLRLGALAVGPDVRVVAHAHGEVLDRVPAVEHDLAAPVEGREATTAVGGRAVVDQR